MASTYGVTKSAPFEIDFKWQQKFIPELKRICGEHLIGEAPYEEDAERNTDLIVLKLEPVRVACRVRRYKYYENKKYRDEFTIRSDRPNGNKTELAKIIEGWGDYILYGFSNEAETCLISWFLGDLTVFRYWFNRYLAENKGRVPGFQKSNHDGSSDFIAFKLDNLPTEFVLVRHL